MTRVNSSPVLVATLALVIGYPSTSATGSDEPMQARRSLQDREPGRSVSTDKSRSRLDRSSSQRRLRAERRRANRCRETGGEFVARIGCTIVEFQTGCSSGGVLFDHNFDADTVGASPDASPNGLPLDDRLTTTGGVVVGPPTSNSNALRPLRSGELVRIDARPGFGSELAGSYCVSFSGQIPAELGGQTTVSLSSRSGLIAWQLELDRSGLSLATGQGLSKLATRVESGDVLRFQFEVDARRGQFDLHIDDTLVEEAFRFVDDGFDSPQRLRFEYQPDQIDGLPGGLILDDISIRATSNLDATTVLIVRHAERATTDSNSDLAPDDESQGIGLGRAEILDDLLASLDVRGIYTTEFCRTAQTAQPSARRFGLPLQVVQASFGEAGIEGCNPPIEVPTQPLPTSLDTNREITDHILANHTGEVVLLVAHSGTVPELVESLGAPSVCPDVLPVGAGGICRIPSEDFSHLFVVTVPNDAGSVKVTHRTYGPP